MRKLFSTLALGIALSLGMVASSYAQAGIQVTIAPPAVQTETIPASPGGGAIWTPGFYHWDAGTQTYVWQAGIWQVPPHRHMIWVGAHTVSLKNGGYEYFSGHWATKHQAHEEREAEEEMER